jgi:hypothetical protein
MVTPEEQPFGDLVERPVQANFRYQSPVSEMVAAVQRRPAEDLHPNNAAAVVVPAV